MIGRKKRDVTVLSISCPNFKLNTQIGGFAGHTLNNYAQSYSYKSDTENEVIKIRKRVNHKGYIWFDKYNRKFSISEFPCKFYDYNF